MKRFLIGVLVGVMLATSISAYALTRVTAEVVEFRYRVNGQYVVPNGISLAANGRAFLPVRAMGEVFGYMVEFVAESNTIVLNRMPEPISEPPITIDWSLYFNDVLRRNTGGFEVSVQQGESFVRVSALAILLLGEDARLLIPGDAPRTFVFPFRGQHITASPAGVSVNGVLRATRVTTLDGATWHSLREVIEVLGGQFAHEGRTIRVTFN